MRTTTKVAGLFRHADLQHMRAMLEASPTARSWMSRIDQLPVRVTIDEVPKTLAARAGRKLEKASHTAMYHPVFNSVYLQRLSLTRDPVVVSGRTLAGPTAEGTATMVLHEGIHRVQRGTLPAYLLDLMVLTPGRMARAAVSELRSAEPAGRGAARRIWDGVRSGGMDHEVKAYRESGRAAVELGWPGMYIEDGRVLSERRIVDSMLREPMYQVQLGLRIVPPLVAGGAIAKYGYDALRR